MRGGPIITLAVSGLLAGCLVGPDYERPAAPTPVRFKEAEGWKLGEPQDAADRGAWWAIYNDPVLDELERQIDISNQTLRAAEAAYRQARAVVAEARGALSDTRRERRRLALWSRRRRSNRELRHDGERRCHQHRRRRPQRQSELH
jgi:hypothetical protein